MEKISRRFFFKSAGVCLAAMSLAFPQIAKSQDAWGGDEAFRLLIDNYYPLKPAEIELKFNKKELKS